MHTYKHEKDGPWTVGFFEPPTVDSIGNSKMYAHWWTPLKDFSTEVEAAAYASYLNGGARPQ